MKNKLEFTPKMAQEAYGLFRNGESIKSISKKYNADIGVVKAAIAPFLRSDEKDSNKPSYKTQFTEDEIMDMLRLKNNGMSSKQIADKCGSTQTIVDHMIKMNRDKFNRLFGNGDNGQNKVQQTAVAATTPIAKRSRVTEDEKSQILEYHEFGFTTKEIAEIMERSEKTIRVILAMKAAEQSAAVSESHKEPEVHLDEPQPEATFTEEELLKMFSMRRSGISLERISETFGISVDTLDIIMKGTAQPRPVEIQQPPKREKTLDDFSPREMLQHLYNLGYRIENNRIFFYEKKEVLMSEIINTEENRQ